MTVLADLHTHSTASDGQYAPAALVEKAAAAGIQVLAVTDHDTIDGSEEAVQAGTALGLTVLRGVELGAAEDRHMHILGLHLGPECPALTALCRKLRASRDERKFRIVDFLREKGMDVSLEEVEALAGGGVVARPHFAQVQGRAGTPLPAGLCGRSIGGDPPYPAGEGARRFGVLLSPSYPGTNCRLSASCGKIWALYHSGQRFPRGSRPSGHQTDAHFPRTGVADLTAGEVDLTNTSLPSAQVI